MIKMPFEKLKQIPMRDISDSSFTPVTVELPDGTREIWEVANYDATDTSGRRISELIYTLTPVDFFYLPIEKGREDLEPLPFHVLLTIWENPEYQQLFKGLRGRNSRLLGNIIDHKWPRRMTYLWTSPIPKSNQKGEITFIGSKYGKKRIENLKYGNYKNKNPNTWWPTTKRTGLEFKEPIRLYSNTNVVGMTSVISRSYSDGLTLDLTLSPQNRPDSSLGTRYVRLKE